MDEKFIPKLDILPSSQRRLWDEFIDVPEDFTLYGGTAIALHLGHRESIDFDFFGKNAFKPKKLITKMPFLEDSEILQSDENTLTCSVKRGEPVMVSFFGLPSIGQIKNPHKSDDNGLKVASLLDLAGTKVATVQQRATFKDYVDIATIIENGDIDLPTAISAAQLIYGQQFNPQITLKALSYFKDITNLSKHHQNVLLEAVTKTDLDKLPDLRPVKNFVKRDNGL